MQKRTAAPAPLVLKQQIHEHPDGMQIRTRQHDDKVSFLLHAALLAKEVATALKHFNTAIETFEQVTCSEVSGDSNKHAFEATLEQLQYSIAVLKNVTGPLGYICMVVEKSPALEPAFMAKLDDMGHQFLRQGAVHEEVWKLMHDHLITQSGIKDAYDVIAEKIASVQQEVSNLHDVVKTGTTFAALGTSAERLGKSRSVSVDVIFMHVRMSWNMLGQMLFIAKMCCREQWFNLNNFGPTLPQTPTV